MLAGEQLVPLEERFISFGAETRGRSALYGHLSPVLANEDVALGLLAEAPPPQRRPNLLFAAVHDLLLAGLTHPLARFYPTTGGAALDAGRLGIEVAIADARLAFLDLLEAHREPLLDTIRSRSTQTNEIGRCAALWPAAHQVARWAGDRPLALIEVGASGGLLLHLDRYGYRHGGSRSGVLTSPATVTTEVRGQLPDLTVTLDIRRRTGIDLTPLDVGHPPDARWLRACVWPEDLPRRARLDAAMEVARRHDDVELVEGDAVAGLRQVLARLPDEVVPCVLHSATLAYLPGDARERFDDVVAEAGRRRDLAWLSLEGPFLEPFASRHRALPFDRDDEVFLLGRSTWTGGTRDDALLARVQPHGAWVDWLADP